MNAKETKLFEKALAALEKARAFVEPHPSWKDDQLRREALSAIHDVIGASKPELLGWSFEASAETY